MLTRRRVLALGLAGLMGPARGHAAGEALPAVRLAAKQEPERLIDQLSMTGPEGAVSLTAYRGRLVLLNLWGAWCLPCRREMPGLSTLAGILAGEAVAILPLAFDWRGLSGASQFYTETGITNLPALTGDPDNLKDTAQVIGLPSTLILTREGRHAWTVSGEARWDDDETVAWIREMIAAA
jgi:thiol-disulfide isomerase/thioredoxin